MFETKRAAVALAAVVFFICASAAEARQVQQGTKAYQQSPFLSSKAQLDPVQDRLPLRPVVLDPTALFPSPAQEGMAVGEFGGSLTVLRETSARIDVASLALRENLLGAPNWDPSVVQANILEKWHVHPNRQHFRLQLRAGLRWSDGAPVTTRDVAFAFHEIWFNPELNFMGIPDAIRSRGHSQGSPVTLTVEDDMVFYLAFDEPYGGFVRALTELHPAGYTDFVKPAHHLSAFHPNHADSADLQDQLHSTGSKYTWELMQSKDCQPQELGQDACTGFPVLQPWSQIGVEPDGTTRLERNPWYFKVDPDGRQLPYIDTVIVVPTTNPYASLANTGSTLDIAVPSDAWHRQTEYLNLAGLELTFHNLERTEEPVALHLNHSGGGVWWQALISTPDFGRAVALAIDRPELARIFGLHTADLSHDPDQANALLDAMESLQQIDQQIRTGPEGNSEAITLSFLDDGLELHRIARQVVQDSAEVGLSVTLEPLTHQQFAIQMHANQLQLSLAPSGRYGWAFGATVDYLPSGTTGRQWKLWHDSNREWGTEPPGPILQLYELNSILV